MVTVPARCPVMAGTSRGGVVISIGMTMLGGQTEATVGLLLDSVMVTPPDGAGVVSATERLAVASGPMVMLAGMVTEEFCATATVGTEQNANNKATKRAGKNTARIGNSLERKNRKIAFKTVILAAQTRGDSPLLLTLGPQVTRSSFYLKSDDIVFSSTRRRTYAGP